MHCRHRILLISSLIITNAESTISGVTEIVTAYFGRVYSGVRAYPGQGALDEIIYNSTQNHRIMNHRLLCAISIGSSPSVATASQPSPAGRCPRNLPIHGANHATKYLAGQSRRETDCLPKTAGSSRSERCVM
jgi:hypothetical protein